MVATSDTAKPAAGHDITRVASLRAVVSGSSLFWRLVAFYLVVVGIMSTSRALIGADDLDTRLIDVVIVLSFVLLCSYQRTIAYRSVRAFLLLSAVLLIFQLFVGVFLVGYVGVVNKALYIGAIFLLIPARYLVKGVRLFVPRSSRRQLSDDYQSLILFDSHRQREREAFETLVSRLQAQKQGRRSRNMARLCRAGAIGLVILSVFIALFLFSDVLIDCWRAALLLSAFSDAVDLCHIWIWKSMFLFIITLIPLLVLSGILLLRARRYRAALASAVRDVDVRPPVLLLRSFADDALRMTGTRFQGGRLSGLFSRRTVEQFFVELYLGEGPVITVGEPHEKLPRVGAARAYFTDLQWRDAVAKLIDESQRILIIVNNSTNLIWEFGTIITNGHLQKAMLIIPPVKDNLLARRWGGFLDQLGQDTVRNSLATISLANTLLICFREGAQTYSYNGRRRSAHFYFSAVALAANNRMAWSSNSLRRDVRRGYRQLAVSATIPSLLLAALAGSVIWDWHTRIESQRREVIQIYRDHWNGLWFEGRGYHIAVDLLPDGSPQKYDDFVVNVVLREAFSDLNALEQITREIYGISSEQFYAAIDEKMYSVVLNADDASLQALARSTAALLRKMLISDVNVCKDWMFSAPVSFLHSEWFRYSGSLGSALTSGRQRSGSQGAPAPASSALPEEMSVALRTLSAEEKQVLLALAERRDEQRSLANTVASKSDFDLIKIKAGVKDRFTVDEERLRLSLKTNDPDAGILCRAAIKFYDNLSQMPPAAAGSVMRADPLGFTSR